MFFPFLHSVFWRLTLPWPLFVQAATWTIVLTLTVAVASFAPEVAFVSAISPSSRFSSSCNGNGFGLVRLPVEFPREVICLPAQAVRRSKLDFFVPTMFAALAVASSACLVRSLGWWDEDIRL